jgi:hypothetical protein
MIVTILILIGLFCAFMSVNYMDRWSTWTLFRYQRMLNESEVDRNKWIENNKKIGETQNEMNSFARIFMNKFGIQKGMKVFTLVWNVPWFVVVMVSVYFNVISLNFVYILLAFYVGALYVQIMRAMEVRKRTKKLGIKI